MYYLLVLYWSQQGYFSFEVQSCTFLFSSTSRINHITLYTWLFLVPSSKQVVDWEESKTILLIPKNQPDNLAVWRILLSRHYSFCWGETTLVFLYKTSRYLESLHMRTGVPCVYVPVAGPILFSRMEVWEWAWKCVSSDDLLSRILLNRMLQYIDSVR